MRPARLAADRRTGPTALSGGRKGKRNKLAGGLGFEPRLTESESAVLPLNYPPPAKTRASGRPRCALSFAGRGRVLAGRHLGHLATISKPARAQTTAAIVAAAPLTQCGDPT